MTMTFRLALALGAWALSACGAADPPPHPIPADADPPPAAGAGLSLVAESTGALKIEGRDGRLVVTASGDDSVRVRVQLTGSGCDRLAHALDSSRRSGELRVWVEPSTKEKCDEVWSIEMPGRVFLVVRMDRADVAVRDLSGGVDVALGKGTLRADVQSGDLRLRVSNGDIIASSLASDYETFEARAEVGDVDVTLDGRRIEHPSPAGPGDWLRLRGTGSERVVLRVTVGSVRYTTGPPARTAPR